MARLSQLLRMSLICKQIMTWESLEDKLCPALSQEVTLGDWDLDGLSVQLSPSCIIWDSFNDEWTLFSWMIRHWQNARFWAKWQFDTQRNLLVPRTFSLLGSLVAITFKEPVIHTSCRWFIFDTIFSFLSFQILH